MEMTIRNAVVQSRRAVGRTGIDYLRFGLRISVWVRRFAVIAWLAQLHHQVSFAHPGYIAQMLFGVLLLALNGYVLYRIETKRTASWRWVLALSAMDVVMLTGGLVVSSGFGDDFFVLYYAALAMFAAVCASIRVSFVGATAISAMYIALSLTSEPGGGFEFEEEEVLLSRIIAMYAVVAAVGLVARFERIRSSYDRARRRKAVERERELLQERIELSQTIHDIIAQSAYLIGLGLESAIEMAEARRNENRRELIAKLEATLAPSKSAMWELRHPIDIGAIFEGQGLSWVLQSHASTFTTVTSIPTEVLQSGKEPELPTATRRALFSIAHNALTNAFRHSRASKIIIKLDFEDDWLRMSILDDGIGLPDDFSDRGQGFRNMRADVERISGSMVAGPGESGQGTTVSCTIPYHPDKEGLVH